MRKTTGSFILFFALILLIPISISANNPLIYDYADIIPDAEEENLEAFAREYSDKWETDFVLLTVTDTEGKAIEDFQGDFYDEFQLGYDQPNGNTVLFTIDMGSREVFLAGYKKGKDYLTDSRLNNIRDEILPYITDGNYKEVFQLFIEEADSYMNKRPEIYFQTWFQLLVAIVVGAAVVGIMLMNSGGKVTINDRTYMDTNNSKVIARRDTYLRKTVTKRKKPSNKSGGGGVTRGGSSYSGSKGSF